MLPERAIEDLIQYLYERIDELEQNELVLSEQDEQKEKQLFDWQVRCSDFQRAAEKHERDRDQNYSRWQEALKERDAAYAKMGGHDAVSAFKALSSLHDQLGIERVKQFSLIKENAEIGDTVTRLEVMLREAMNKLKSKGKKK